MERTSLRKTKAVVLDFEATCSNDRSFNPMEIIEFPSILLHIDYDRELKSFEELLAFEDVPFFSSFVRPVVNPILTPFCTELTSITQEQVDQAKPFTEVFELHQQWLKANYCTPENTLFVTCGDWDLKTMLPNQCSLIKTFVPEIYKKWINVKKLYKHHYGTDRVSMASMAANLNFEIAGTVHRGIDDTYNIARIFLELIKPSRTLQATRTL